MQTGLTLYQKAQSVSCLHHSHLSCTTSNTLQAPDPLGSWVCPDGSISSGTAEHRAELALEPWATAVEQVTTGRLLHASRMREQDARAPCSHPRALPTEWYVLHVCCSAPLCMERLPQSNQWGNLLGGRMGPVSNSQLDTSCLETALLFSTYLCPQLQPAKLSHFKQ